MAEHIETELKLRFLDPGCWERVLESTVIAQWGDPLSFCQEMLEAEYFDTPSHRLRKARLAFRIRREGGEWLATVKDGGQNAGGLHQRAEWTVALSEPAANIEVFMDTPIGPVLAEAVGEESLQVLFKTYFERQRLNLQTPAGSIVEFAADRGEISTSEGRAPILEIELELKSGSVGDLLRLGADLAQEFPLLPEWRSKYFRALQLAGLANTDEISPSEHIPINGAAVAGTVLPALLTGNIQNLLAAQGRCLHLPEDPEIFLQMHGRLLRLWALWAFSAPFIPEETHIRYQETLQNQINALAPVSETAAVKAAWQEVVDSNWVHFSGSSVLGGKLAEKHADVVAHMHNELRKGQLTPKLLHMWAWLDDNAFLLRTEEEECAEIAVPTPFGAFAREQLTTWLAGMAKAGKNIDIQENENVDALYMLGLKSRGVLESLTVLWPKRAGRLIERMQDLEESFRCLRNTHSGRRLLQELLRAQSSRLLYRDMGVLTGWQAHQAQAAERRIKKQWKRFLRIAQKWSGKA